PPPPAPPSPARALGPEGPPRPPAVHLAGERRPRIRGATRGPYWRTDPRNEGRGGGGGAPVGRLSPLVGSGGGPDGARTARTLARAAALRGALFLLSLVAAPRREARPSGAHPRPRLRPPDQPGA